MIDDGMVGREREVRSEPLPSAKNRDLTIQNKMSWSRTLFGICPNISQRPNSAQVDPQVSKSQPSRVYKRASSFVGSEAAQATLCPVR
jgi:hypothetical protein